MTTLNVIIQSALEHSFFHQLSFKLARWVVFARASTLNWERAVSGCPIGLKKPKNVKIETFCHPIHYNYPRLHNCILYSRDGVVGLRKPFQWYVTQKCMQMATNLFDQKTFLPIFDP